MAWQLNELVMDLKTPTDVMILLKGEAKNGMQIMSLSRMILSALFVNLRKITEIIDHYGSDLRLLPTDVRNDLIKIKKAIDDKGIYKYRSTYIAHAFTQEKGRPKRPLTVAEASKALAIIIDEGLNSIIENVLSFCNWIYKKDDPNCVVNILYRTVQAVESIVGGLGARP
jgi:hypothetical protein